MDRKIEYTVVSEHDEDELVKAVNKLLDDGWELYGGVSCALSETDDVRYTMFTQAMTRLLSPGEQAKKRAEEAGKGNIVVSTAVSSGVLDDEMVVKLRKRGNRHIAYRKRP